MFTNLTRTRLTVVSLFVLSLAGASGCQIFPDRLEWPTKLFGKEEKAVVPTRMMVMWADTVLHQPQQPGVRGFGARIYFYSEDDPDPVKVDGGLAVYAFDADELNPKSAKPKRKYVFTDDQFAEHMSHTSMGTSYSVWCPWDEVGGYNEQLSLIVRFEGRSGGVVISDATVKLLPGLNKPANVAETSKQKGSAVAQATALDDVNSSTQLAGFEKVSSESSMTKPPRRQTETIDLPPSFYRHLSGPAEPAATATIPLASIPSATVAAEPDAPEAGSSEPKPAESASSLKREQYPFRTLGDKQLDATSHGTYQQSLPAGWIPSLPKTPRYGYPHAAHTTPAE